MCATGPEEVLAPWLDGENTGFLQPIQGCVTPGSFRTAVSVSRGYQAVLAWCLLEKGLLPAVSPFPDPSAHLDFDAVGFVEGPLLVHSVVECRFDGRDDGHPATEHLDSADSDGKVMIPPAVTFTQDFDLPWGEPRRQQLRSLFLFDRPNLGDGPVC